MPLIRIFLFVFFYLGAVYGNASLHAQVTGKYEEETIYLKFATYVKNNKEYDIGLTGGGLKKEMSVSPDAMYAFEKYQRQRRWMIGLSIVQTAAEITALTTKNKSLRTGLLIGSGALAGVSLTFFIGSTQKLNKAVWLRNRDVLKKSD